MALNFAGEEQRIFLKNNTQSTVKNQKMIGVTLRYKWITWAMFMGPGLEPVLPLGRLSQKMYTYHLDRAPWSLAKTHSPLCIIKKKQNDCCAIHRR